MNAWLVGVLTAVAVSAVALGATGAPAGGTDEITLQVPDAAWRLAVDAVYAVGNEVWVIASVRRDPNMMGAQMITTLKAKIPVDPAGRAVKVFVLGKTWGWANEEPYRFLSSRDEIAADLKPATRLFPK
jgi:hypothetical protein